MIDGWGISCGIASYECHWTNADPDLCWHMLSLGHNELIVMNDVYWLSGLFIHQVFLHLKGLFLVSRILTVSLTPESIFHFLGHFSWSLPATYIFSCMVLSNLQPFSSSIQIIVKFSTKSRNTYVTANWLNGVEDSKLPTCIEPSLCLDIKDHLFRYRDSHKTILPP